MWISRLVARRCRGPSQELKWSFRLPAEWSGRVFRRHPTATGVHMGRQGRLWTDASGEPVYHCADREHLRRGLSADAIEFRACFAVKVRGSGHETAGRKPGRGVADGLGHPILRGRQAGRIVPAGRRRKKDRMRNRRAPLIRSCIADLILAGVNGGTEAPPRLLVLTRKSNQGIMIGDDIEVSVLSIMGEKVRIGIQAPRTIPVFRKEVYLEIQQEKASGTRAEVDEVLGNLSSDERTLALGHEHVGSALSTAGAHARSRKPGG